MGPTSQLRVHHMTLASLSNESYSSDNDQFRDGPLTTQARPEEDHLLWTSIEVTGKGSPVSGRSA